MKRIPLVVAVLLSLSSVQAWAVPMLRIPFEFGPPAYVLPTAEHLAFDYDDNHAMTSPLTILNTDCRHGCTVEPLLPDGALAYYQWHWQDVFDSVLATSMVHSIMVGVALPLEETDAPEPIPAPIPEPATWLLLALGLAGLVRIRAQHVIAACALLMVAAAPKASAGDILESAVIAASAADFASTQYALATCPGCRESNPMLRSTLTRLTLKVAGGVALTALNRKLAEKKPRAAKIVRLALVALYTGATANNIRKATTRSPRRPS